MRNFAADFNKFEKVKTQNKLRPEHIQNIVDTYRERREIERNKRAERFSHSE